MTPAPDGEVEGHEAKRRRFLERNRVAASKCRQKKKAWVQDLEAEAHQYHANCERLRATVDVLSSEVLLLKSQLLKHNTCECYRIRQYLGDEAARLGDSGGGGGGAGGCGVQPAKPGASSRNYVSSLSSVSDDGKQCTIHPALQSSGHFDVDIDDDDGASAAAAASLAVSMD